MSSSDGEDSDRGPASIREARQPSRSGSEWAASAPTRPAISNVRVAASVVPSDWSENWPLAEVVAEPESIRDWPEAEIEAAVTVAPSTSAEARRAVAASLVTRPW